MHFSLIGLALVIGGLLRWQAECQRMSGEGNWSARWQFALSRFILPPLLLLTMSGAVLWMGMDGAMLGFSAGSIGYLFAIVFLGFAFLTLLYRLGQGWRSAWQVGRYPCETVAQVSSHLLDTDIPFAAQVGFWRSKLVVSRGLLHQLNEEQIEAVLTHEQAHAYYRDTFWFFWLGWLGQITFWLPQTEALWQELLLLRELRADAWAAQRVDSIVVAESLLQIVQKTQTQQIQVAAVRPDIWQAGFNADLTLNRLEERVEALLAPSDLTSQMASPGRSWFWLGLGFLPLLTLPLHV